jgi:hypothetical protein
VFAACQERLDEMVQLMRKASKNMEKNEISERSTANEIDTKSTL